MKLSALWCLTVFASSTQTACGSPIAKCHELCAAANGSRAEGACSHCDDKACAQAIAERAERAPSSLGGFELGDLAYAAAYTSATVSGVCK